MAKKTTLAAVIIVHNEEERVRRVLSSVRPYVDEIVVVDDMSTDRTTAIASSEFGAKIVPRSLAGDFAAQRNAGTAAATAEWVLQLDADEVVPEPTMREIRQLIGAEGSDGLRVRRLNHFLGQPLKHCAQDNGTVRVYRRTKGRCEGPIHEEVKIEGAVLDVDGAIWHYPAEKVETLILKALRYMETEAELFCQAHGSISERQIRQELTWKSLRRFWKIYIKKNGCRDGLAGLVWCVLNTIGPQIRWMKVWEKARAAGKLAK